MRLRLQNPSMGIYQGRHSSASWFLSTSILPHDVSSDPVVMSQGERQSHRSGPPLCLEWGGRYQVSPMLEYLYLQNSFDLSWILYSMFHLSYCPEISNVIISRRCAFKQYPTFVSSSLSNPRTPLLVLGSLRCSAG